MEKTKALREFEETLDRMAGRMDRIDELIDLLVIVNAAEKGRG